MGKVLKICASRLEVILERINSKFMLISAIIVGLMPIPVFLDVLARFLFSKSVPGVLDIEEFSMVVMVFFALAFIQQKKEHIRIDILTSRLPRSVNNVFECFTSTLSLVLFVLVAYQTFAQALNNTSEVSPSLGIPLFIFMILAAIGSALLALVLLRDFIRSIINLVENKQWPWIVVALAASISFLCLPAILTFYDVELSGVVVGSLGMLTLVTLMMLGMPIGFAMATTGFIGLSVVHLSFNAALGTLGVAPYATTTSFILAVVPLFILMGELAFYSGIGSDLFSSANTWFGRMPGGLSMASVGGCAGFAAVCGDSLATAIAMGSVALPEMEKRKYSIKLATGALAAGGTLGILIPPSIGFIFYAIITEESIGKLFIAGILPGLIMTLLFMLTIYLIAITNPAAAPRGEKYSFKEKIISLKGIIGMLLLFILILGGILGGIFSPTEGGAVGAVGAFAYALLRRRISFQTLVNALRDTMDITCKLLTILIGVGILGYFLAATQLPFELANIVTGLKVNRYIILICVLILFMILGCLMNVIPMLLLTLPAIFPAIKSLGFDPIWFGVISVIIMEMGQITPPVGVNVFALCSVAKGVPMGTIFSGIFPFFICMVITCVILILFPQIATVLPNLLFK